MTIDRAVVSDDAAPITKTIDRWIGRGLFHPNCVRLLCAWHAVSQDLFKVVCGLTAEESTQRSVVRIMVHHALNYAETPDEFAELWSDIELWVRDNTALDAGLKHKICGWLEKVLEKSSLLARAFRIGASTLDTTTTGRSEAENLVIKYTFHVTNQTSLVCLMQADKLRQELRLFERSVASARAVQTAPVLDPAVTATMPPQTRETFSVLTRYAFDRQLQEYVLAQQYEVQRKAGLILVTRPHQLNGLVQRQFVREGTDEHVSVPLRYYARSRIIRCVGGRLRCPCGLHSDLGIVCRHLIAVNRNVIEIDHLNVRWLACYAGGLLSHALGHLNTQDVRRTDDEDGLQADMDTDEISGTPPDSIEPAYGSDDEEDTPIFSQAKDTTSYSVFKNTLDEVQAMALHFVGDARGGPDVLRMLQNVRETLSEKLYSGMPSEARAGRIIDPPSRRVTGPASSRRAVPAAEGHGPSRRLVLQELPVNSSMIEEPLRSRTAGRPRKNAEH